MLRWAATTLTMRVQWGGWLFFRASPWAELELAGKGEVLWTETRTVNSQTLTDHFTSSREYREQRGVCTRAPTCPLVTTLSPSLWCCLPTFPFRIFTFRVLITISTEKPALSCPDNLSLTQEVTGHTHTYSCLVGLLPPLHQIAKY